VAIRPEAVHFDADGPYRGEVQKSFFLGSTVEHTVQCAGGVSLLVQTAPGRRAAVGAQVSLSFEPGHAWLISAGT
jgi:putative spermidine/putrescine transport system ATP-binding protein